MIPATGDAGRALPSHPLRAASQRPVAAEGVRRPSAGSISTWAATGTMIRLNVSPAVANATAHRSPSGVGVVLRDVRKRDWSSQRLKSPPLGSTSNSRWIALAWKSVASVMRARLRPVGGLDEASMVDVTLMQATVRIKPIVGKREPFSPKAIHWMLVFSPPGDPVWTKQ